MILEYDHKKIDRMRGLPRIVAETPIGKEVEVNLWRRGERHSITVTLGELPEEDELAALSESGADTPTTAQIDALGVTVATISDELRTRYELTEGVKGVVIVEVKDGGPAGAESLRAGDVIVEVGQEEVTSPPEVAAKVSQAEQDNKKSVLLLVDSQGDLRFVALRFPEPGGGSSEGGNGAPEAPGNSSEGGPAAPEGRGAPPEGGGGSE